MCFWAYGGYFRLSVGGNENRSVFTQQWPSKGNTHSCSVAEENRGKSLCHNWRNQIAALAALSDTLFYYSYLLCILSSRWPRYHMTRPNPAALFVWFQQRQVRMTFMGLMRRGLISSEIQICQCRLMNFNYCRSCFSWTPTVRPARVEHPDWMQRMYRADIWCLDSDLLRAEQTLNSSGHNRESWTPSAVWNLL